MTSLQKPDPMEQERLHTPEMTRREALAAVASVSTLAATALLAPAGNGHLRAAEALYPDDAFSRPLDDRRNVFTTLDGAGPFLRVDDRVRHFAQQDFRIHSEGGRTVARWSFTSRELDHNILVIYDRIRRPPRALSLKMANLAQHPVDVQLDLHELGWLPLPENTAAVWTLGPSQTVPANQERALSFSFSDARTQVRRAIRYPIGALNLKVGGIKPGIAYTVHLSDLTVHYSPAPGITVRALDARIQGSDLVCHMGVETAHPPGLPLDVECRRNERVLWRIRLSDQEVEALLKRECEVRRPVPWWIPPGPVVVGLVSGGYRVSGAEGTVEFPRKRATASQLPLVQRRLHRGRPGVFVNGKPFDWRGYASYEYVPGSVTEFGRSSANMFCVPTCAGRHVYGVAEPTWLEPGRTDFGELDERVCFSLQTNPDAWISLRVNLAMPPWWCQMHPDELARVRTEQGDLIWEEFGHAQVASIASEKWFADQARALRDLIRHCKAQPWACRLAAIWLLCETTEEWFAWGANDGYHSDYSAPMVKAFARESRADSLPTPADRNADGWDIYPDTPSGKLAAAYHGFLSDLTARVLGGYARLVKRETSGRTLVCGFLGYVIQLAGEKRQALSGHFGLRRALDDPHLDVFAGVPLHDFRTLSGGYNPYCSATESIQAAGKIVCNENDLFSWLHNSLWHQPYDPGDPRGAAISMHERECANDAVHGTLQQKFSLAASWHHDAALHRAFEHQARVYSAAMQADRTPAEEIAFLVDDTSFAWTPPDTTVPAITNKHLLRAFGLTGAPVGVWLLSDIERLPERIRFIVVASSYAATGRDIAKLARAIGRGERTFYVVGAPGLVDVERRRWAPDRPERILGLPIRINLDGGSGAVVLTADERGVPSVVRARPRAEGLRPGWLRYVDGPCAGLDRPLRGGGRLLWSGVPVVDTALARAWVERAGVHCYAPTDHFVHASRELLAITASAEGRPDLQWPESVTATDMLDGWTGNGRTFSCPFRRGQTRLFRIRRQPLQDDAPDPRNGTREEVLYPWKSHV